MIRLLPVVFGRVREAFGMFISDTLGALEVDEMLKRLEGERRQTHDHSRWEMARRYRQVRAREMRSTANRDQ